MRTTWAQHQRDTSALPSGRAQCPGCDDWYDAEAIARTDDDRWRCGHCLLSDLPTEPFAIGWSDVRGVRETLLVRTDWVELPSAPIAIKLVVGPLRQEARDLPQQHATPAAAFQRLAAILDAVEGYR